jgi:hypothetical protein
MIVFQFAPRVSSPPFPGGFFLSNLGFGFFTAYGHECL